MKALELLSLHKLRWRLICFFPCFWGNAPVKYKPFTKSIVLPSKTHSVEHIGKEEARGTRAEGLTAVWLETLKATMAQGLRIEGDYVSSQVSDLHVAQLVQCFRLVQSCILPRSWGYANRSLFIKSPVLGCHSWLCPPNLAFPSSITLTTITQTLL